MFKNLWKIYLLYGGHLVFHFWKIFYPYQNIKLMKCFIFDMFEAYTYPNNMISHRIFKN